MSQSMKIAQEFRGAFCRPAGSRALLDLLAYWSALAVVWALSHRSGRLGAYLLAAPIIGGLQHGLLNLAHEAWHSLCFSNRRLNHWMGAWCYAYPLGVFYFHDRSRHLDHHRLVGRREDPDWINYTHENRLPALRLARYLLMRLAGSQLWETGISLFIERRPRIAAAAGTEERSLGAEAWSILLVQGLFLGAFSAAGRWWEYFMLWVLPLATFASFFVSLRSFVEHAQEEARSGDHRLFDFAPGILERFFIAPCHFYLHALHHAYPAIPHFRLLEAKRALVENGRPYLVAERGGYLSSLWSRR